jgi:excisionase family DNA binding protein
MLVDEETVTVAEAARLLHVNPSTIWRWIDQGQLPAYRVGQRRVRVRRADLATMITPARSEAEESYMATIGRHPQIRPLTEEERQRSLEAFERIKKLRAKILARRGGEPFPPSWKEINEDRDERSRQLE